MSESVPSVPEGGNSISPSIGQGKPIPKPVNPAIYWCFTLNNWTKDELDSICSKCSKFCSFAIIGSEVGESGTPHLQGYVEFIKKSRPVGVFDNKRIHFEKCKGDRADNVKYCSKDGNVVFSLGMPKPIKIINNLYEWQKKIEDLILTEPDDRSVHWYYDKKGNIGKSAFIKYCAVKHNVLFCCGGKMADIMNLVFNQDMDNCNCIIFDIPRANEGCVSYSALESIKNGMVCNTKYETGMKLFNAPHLICFANFPPENLQKLSADRWNITNLGEPDSDDEYDLSISKSNV